VYQRRRITQADFAVIRLIIIVTLCLTAYSCAITEQQTTQGVRHGV
jgi:hypothetical protein